ncbi:pyrroline-5-carboxylate reductase [Granulicella rosea]|uniref:Pyrroline-5-carboxylate reductase n=1 Tax=Granulicella rosea TaxID=474952 RepID=A0A239H6M6_9BACT|nr:pyrroline-5-carboxylate reductase [Granulicella rosea]SNS77047.1 pyrroline-5-carboxylate reductase [Granulicella rosea]
MSENKLKLRVAVLGAGKMGGILLQAFVKSGLLDATDVTATVLHESRTEELSAKYGVTVTTDNVEAARNADVILLGVKPMFILSVVKQIAPVLKPGALLVSVAASITTAAIEGAAGGEVAVIRAMPNTPSQVLAGVTALCAGRFVQDEQVAVAERLFGAVGRTVVVAERLMNAVTGLSGSGPAYVFIMIEALAEGGVNVGLPRDVATVLAAQTVEGAAKMVLETGLHPAALKDMVTTPNGTTVAGILALEEGSLRATLINAVKRSAERAAELAG